MAEPTLPNLSDSTVPGLDLGASNPAEIASSGEAIDALFKGATTEHANADASGTPAAKVGDGDEPLATPVVVAPPVVADAAPAVPAADTTPAPPASTETPPAPAAVVPAAPVEEFDKIELPPYTKPKTSEAFATVKTLAKARIASVEKERDELKARVTAAEEQAKAAGTLPPEVEKELASLREFRSKLDVEADPSFREFDTQITQNEESIFSKLKELGTSEETIKKIKEIGVSLVDWDNILDKIPSVARRYIESKLVSNDENREGKARAIEEAQKNSAQFLKERETELGNNVTERQEQTQQHFSELAQKLPWYARVSAPANATPEQRSSADAHNQFLDEVDAAVKEATEDNTPEMKAILTYAYVNLLRNQRENKAVMAGFSAEREAGKVEVAKLTAQIAEKDAFIAKIKKSSSASIRSAPSVEPGSNASQPINYNERPGDALDRLKAGIEA